MATTEMNCLASGGGLKYERHTVGEFTGGTNLSFNNYIDIPISGTPKVILILGTTSGSYYFVQAYDYEWDTTYSMYGGYKDSSNNNANRSPLSGFASISNNTLRYTNVVDTQIGSTTDIIIGY